MDIQIRFEDGTVETRAEWSPCMLNYDEPTLKHPSEERWYRWFYGLSFCGYKVLSLASCRGDHMLVWRITGQDPVTKALIGTWQSCSVETWAEQVERLTQERDAERMRANTEEKRLRAVRTMVTERLAKTNAGNGRIVGCSWAGTKRALAWFLDVLAATEGEPVEGAMGVSASRRDGAERGPEWTRHKQ